jgi:hypothetical protein
MAKPKTIEERLDAIERQVRNQGLNIDLVLNYARELARSQLSAERIADIERELGNGHDAGT